MCEMLLHHDFFEIYAFIDPFLEEISQGVRLGYSLIVGKHKLHGWRLAAA